MGDISMDQGLTGELNRLAAACRILAMEGHDDVSLGHLSLRDPEGRGVWMKRFYLGLDEVRGPDDFLLLDFDGHILHGDGERHAEWPIHTEILKARPDVHVVGHTHPFHACLFAATEDPLQPIGMEGMHFTLNTPHYRETSNLINSQQLGRNLAEALGDARVVFMKNHGITFCGDDIPAAVITGLHLEKACKAQLLLNASGLTWSVPERKEWEGKVAVLGSLGLWDNFFSYYHRKLLRHEGAMAEAERMRAETMTWRRGR